MFPSSFSITCDHVCRVQGETLLLAGEPGAAGTKGENVSVDLASRFGLSTFTRDYQR